MKSIVNVLMEKPSKYASMTVATWFAVTAAMKVYLKVQLQSCVLWRLNVIKRSGQNF